MVFPRAALSGGVLLALSVALHAAEPLAAPKKVILCDLERREEASFIRQAISPNQTTFAAVTDRNALRLWDVATGQELSSIRIEIDGELPRCGSLVFAPDGRHIAATFEGMRRDQPRFSVYLWDISPAKQLTSGYALLVQRWDDGTPCVAQHLAFSPDSRTLVAGSPSRTVYLWETATKQERLRFLGGVAAAFTPDGRSLLTVDFDGIVTRRDPATGKPLDAEGPTKPAYHHVRLLAFAPDGSKIAVADDETLLIKDTTSNACLGRFEPSEPPHALAFSPDGGVLVVNGSNGLWFLDGKTCKLRSWLPYDNWSFVGFCSGTEIIGEDRNTLVARHLAMLLASTAKPPEKKRPDPKKSDVAVELIASRDTYDLDLGGKSAAEFSKLLFEKAPSPPKVELALKVRNSSDHDIKFMPDAGNLKLYLVGDGAVNVPDHPSQVLFVPSERLAPVTLAPGKSHSLRLTSLKSLGRGAYWLSPGEYTLHASYEPTISPPPPGTFAFYGYGHCYGYVHAAPIKLTVREAKK